jgi:hypothetical protein
MTAARSGWYPDPTGRHRTRWWDGVEWRGWVDGRAGDEADPLRGTDPLGPPSGQSPTPPSTQPGSGRNPGCLIVTLVALWVIGGGLTLGIGVVFVGGSEMSCADSGTNCGSPWSAAILLIGLLIISLITALVIVGWLAGARRDGRPQS